MRRAAYAGGMEHSAFGSRAEKVTIKVSQARVLRDGASVALSRREVELALALAFRSGPSCADALSGCLYPDLDQREARNNLKVYVYRLRQRVGPDFIVWTGSGYEFGSNVEVDFIAARQLAEALTHAALPASERSAGVLLAQDLRAEAPRWIAEREWFACASATA